MTACRLASVQVYVPNNDGTITARGWAVCVHDVEKIAAMLGAPDSSVIATAEAREAMRQAFNSAPGIVAEGVR